MTEINEIWKSMPPPFSHYEFSNRGRGRSTHNGIVRYLKFHINNSGYFVANLRGERSRTNPLVHRIIATLFIPNESGLPFVDHIDTNRRNNSVSNLRWCTRLENNENPLTKINFINAMRAMGEAGLRSGKNNGMFGRRGKLSPRSKRVVRVDTEEVFESIALAAESIGVAPQQVSKVITGRCSHVHGIRFRYE